jgi:hypothetical protein
MAQERKLWGQPLTRDSPPIQGQAFEISISRPYYIRLGEFVEKVTAD